MAQPCCGSSARIFRSSKSRVPCIRSAGLLIGPPFIPLVTEGMNQPIRRKRSGKSWRLLRRCERWLGARWADAFRFDLLKVLRPRLAVVGGLVGVPQKAVGRDVVVPNAERRRLAAGDAKALFDAHLGSDAFSGPEVLQAVRAVHADQFPLAALRVVIADGGGHVNRPALAVDQPIFVENLSGR